MTLDALWLLPAGWCAVGKAASPSMCRLANNKQLAAALHPGVMYAVL
jgi:hypothetical protein